MVSVRRDLLLYSILVTFLNMFLRRSGPRNSSVAKSRPVGMICEVSETELAQNKPQTLNEYKNPAIPQREEPMQMIAFCTRCRGMRIGWNGRYILHLMTCKEWVSRSSKLLILTALLAILVFAFPTPSAIFFSNLSTTAEADQPVPEAGTFPLSDPSVAAIDSFLEKHSVDGPHRARVASAIVASSRKYNLDPRLIASIMIVESRANPFAISSSDSVGIMQIHLHTWGTTADREGINLFKIEDNVDFGARILKDYSRRFGGVWEGVKRYKGWNADSPESTQNVMDYLQKVRGIYSTDLPRAR